jgi:hypothetical protein
MCGHGEDADMRRCPGLWEGETYWNACFCGSGEVGVCTCGLRVGESCMLRVGRWGSFESTSTCRWDMCLVMIKL